MQTGEEETNEDHSTDERLSGSPQLVQQLGNRWLATLRLNHSSTKHRSQTDNYAFGIPLNGDVRLYSSAFRIDNDVWAGELRLEGSVDVLGRPMNTALGGDHTDAQNVNDQFFGTLGTATIYDQNFASFLSLPIAASTVSSSNQVPADAPVQVRPFDRLSVLLGGRYDSAETTFANRVGATRGGKG